MDIKTRTPLYARNPWHFVNHGYKAPDLINAVIEIPKGSKAKYELDKESGLLKLDRVLFSAVHYPANYGFIPQTYCEDHDPLDILVYSSIDAEPLCLIQAKVIGVMHMLDKGERDDKIIAVCNTDVSVQHINDLEEMPPYAMEEIVRFFEDYKKLEKKEVKVSGIKGKEEAVGIIKEAIDLYKKTFANEEVGIFSPFLPAQAEKMILEKKE